MTPSANSPAASGQGCRLPKAASSGTSIATIVAPMAMACGVGANERSVSPVSASARRGNPMQNVGQSNGTHAGRPATVGYRYCHKPARVAASSSVTPHTQPAIATPMSRRPRHVRSVCARSAAITAAHATGHRNVRQTPPTATTVLMATWRSVCWREGEIT